MMTSRELLERFPFARLLEVLELSQLVPAQWLQSEYCICILIRIIVPPVSQSVYLIWPCVPQCATTVLKAVQF